MGEWRYSSTILDLGTRRGRMVSLTPRPLYSWHPLARRLEVAPVLFGTLWGKENLWTLCRKWYRSREVKPVGRRCIDWASQDPHDARQFLLISFPLYKLLTSDLLSNTSLPVMFSCVCNLVMFKVPEGQVSLRVWLRFSLPIITPISHLSFRPVRAALACILSTTNRTERRYFYVVNNLWLEEYSLLGCDAS
jgi:hypothetical protein